ncbi:MAG: outer membrane beta-barrel protein [Parafilimonas terrae]|nr:outer membrane beta-barrel protein [Parafilimonas terrae]
MTFAVTSTVSGAQTPRFDAISPVTGQPDNPGVGQETGPDGLPFLRRRLSDSDGGDRARGSTLPGTRGASGADGASSGAGQSFPGSTGFSRPDARTGLGGSQTGGASTGINNRGLSGPLRVRAAPPRRSGVATQKATREVTQITTQSPDLIPVIQQPVSGVPLPLASAGQRLPLLATSPILGLLTPGFILGTDLSRPIPADPAYAPIGYKIGSFTVLPSFTQSVGYDSNPDQTTRQLAKGSVAFRTEAAVDFRSDWSSSSLDGSLRGAYLETPQNEIASRPAADGLVNLRIDASRDLQINAQGRFILDTQRTTSPNLQAVTATGRPLVALYGATLGATKSFNRLSVTLSGAVDRSEFQDASLSNGTVIRQSDRNLNQYSLRLRTAYELTPDFIPFVDVIGDTRVYDQRVDAFGVQRNSDGVSVLAGAQIGFARTLTGEVSAGAQRRDYVDRTLRNIDAPLVNATLTWAATPLTTVRFNAATGVTETTIPGSSGVLTEVATLEVQHDLLRNLSIVLGGSILHNEYRNSPIRDDGFSTTARLDYRFTRWLTLRAAYIFQQVNSTSPGSSFRDNTVLVGMRVNP